MSAFLVTQLSPTLGQGNTGNTRSNTSEDANIIDKKKEILRHALSKNPDVYSIFTGNKIEWIRDKYDILGTGVYGMVVKYKLSSGTDVAVKFIEDYSEDDNDKEPYVLSDTTLAEIGSLVALYEGYTREGKPIGYPNVLSPIDIFHISNITGIVFPLANKDLVDMLDNKEIEKLVGKGKEGQKIKQIILEDISLQILRGIIYIESRDILNGDYKMENILLFDTGKNRIFKVADKRINYPCYRAVIADFSLSITNKCYNYNTGGTTFFSGIYKSPELVYGDRYTTKADVWAFGIMLYFLFVGEFPFKDQEDYDSGDKDEESGINRHKGEINEVLRTFGQPTEKTWPGIRGMKYYKTIDNTIQKVNGKEEAIYRKVGNKKLVSLLKKIFVLNPDSRISIDEVLDSDFFSEAIGRQNTIDCIKSPNIEVPDTCLNLLEARSFIQRPDSWNEYRIERDNIISKIYNTLNEVSASPRIYILSIKILEDVLNDKRIIGKKKDINVYIAACVHIASLTAEIETYNEDGEKTNAPITVDELVQKMGVNKVELYNVEWEVLTIIRVDIYRSTSMDFILTYTNSNDSNINEKRNVIISWCKLFYYIPGIDSYTEDVIALGATLLGYSYYDEKLPDFVRGRLRENQEAVINLLINIMEYCSEMFFDDRSRIRDNGSKLKLIYHGAIILDNTSILKEIVNDKKRR